MLSACKAVISGSAALHMVLPANTCSWPLSDLDIYVSHSHQAQLYNLLQNHHFTIVCQGHACLNDYSPSTIFTVTTFSNNGKLVIIIISRTSSVLSPIFQFHSTTIMNFFSANSLFCTYPSLTLCHCTMIN
ncbi:hypothetical protein F5J12DRAFT_698907, partial [Pisolithus orientalis]|uniref:uncharacterized protein n=1 Tax=Pisolithus orientalis TaxID=936130 RepID=UPI0022247543